MKTLTLNQQLISLETPIIMGILNITEDSFFDGGCYLSEAAVINRVKQMADEGAAIIDLGAVSTKPNAIEIDENKEFEAIRKHLQLILAHFPEIHISVDTFRASVAAMAIEEGAAMINDISGGADPKMFEVVGKHHVPYILTHNNRSQPLETKALIPKMLSFFGAQIEKLVSKGVHDIIIDPGFGFGKTVEQNYYLLKHLESFTMLGFPIMVGISRKSMIQKVLETSPAESLTGTIALNMVSLCHRASILRVHDIKQCAETIKLFNVLCSF